MHKYIKHLKESYNFNALSFDDEDFEEDDMQLQKISAKPLSDEKHAKMCVEYAKTVDPKILKEALFEKIQYHPCLKKFKAAKDFYGISALVTRLKWISQMNELDTQFKLSNWKGLLDNFTISNYMNMYYHLGIPEETVKEKLCNLYNSHTHNYTQDNIIDEIIIKPCENGYGNIGHMSWKQYENIMVYLYSNIFTQEKTPQSISISSVAVAPDESFLYLIVNDINEEDYAAAFIPYKAENINFKAADEHKNSNSHRAIKRNIKAITDKNIPSEFHATTIDDEDVFILEYAAPKFNSVLDRGGFTLPFAVQSAATGSIPNKPESLKQCIEWTFEYNTFYLASGDIKTKFTIKENGETIEPLFVKEGVNFDNRNESILIAGYYIRNSIASRIRLVIYDNSNEILVNTHEQFENKMVYTTEQWKQQGWSKWF